MTEEQKLQLGIEIVSAMKASSSQFEFDIEAGRFDALYDTEVDSFCEAMGIDYNAQPDEQKERMAYICKIKKDRLHKQALFVADIALAKIEELNNTTT